MASVASRDAMARSHSWRCRPAPDGSWDRQPLPQLGNEFRHLQHGVPVTLPGGVGCAAGDDLCVELLHRWRVDDRHQHHGQPDRLGREVGQGLLELGKAAPYVPVVPSGEFHQFLRPLPVGFAHLPVGRVGVVPGHRFLQPVRGGRQPPCLIVEDGLHGAGQVPVPGGWGRR